MARNYRLRGGRYEGVYPIYNDIKEFNELKPEGKLLTWSVSNPYDIQAGHHIEAEDGFIVPVITLRMWKDKYDRETWFVRFPMGTFNIWRLASGKLRWSRFYAIYTVNDKSSASQLQYTTHRGVDKCKKRFGVLIAGGIKPVPAYLMAFGINPFLTHRLNAGLVSIKATNLLREDIVLEEIKSTLMPFQDSINKKFNNEKLLTMMEEHDKEVKPGTATYQKWMEFVMELRGLLSTAKSRAALNVKDPDGKVSQASTASYTEVPQEQIGPPLNH